MSESITTENKFIQKNSPDGALNHTVQGEFLQSEEWRKFQESAGRRTYCVTGDNFYASVIEHQLPIVGKYFYIPKGPIFNQFSISNEIPNSFSELIKLAKENNAGWIRIEPNNSRLLDLIGTHWRVVKAPHDMQPREILVIDITKPEEQLLSEMKSKTRYNIKVAQKHGVIIQIVKHETRDKDIREFLKLVKITAERDKITPHPESYYRKMFEAIPSENIKLYIAEYNNKVIADNIVIYYGNTATYLHGASNNEHRNVMAPYLLQWQAITDVKAAGLTRYDFGGIKSDNMQHKTCNNNWAGITRFKTGFAPNTKPTVYPGSYDIILNSSKYYTYKILQKIKNFL